MDFGTFFTSAVVAALISGIVTLWSLERKIQIENITQERAKWRSKIRENALLVHKAATQENKVELAELKTIFALLLNPHDPEDRKILEIIQHLQNTPESESKLGTFAGRVSYLLKHDWERAKYEARPWYEKICCRSCCSPIRKTYPSMT